jgi:hypothetical protein
MRVLRLRRTSRAIAVLLLLVAATGAVHFDKGDQACAPVIVDHHDESKHAIHAAAPVEHSHCAVCHWTRLPRTAFVAIAFAQTLSANIVIDERDPFTLRAPALDRLPARAPPVRL